MKKTFPYRGILVSLFALALAVPALGAGNDWWNDDWEGRWRIVLTETGGAERIREVVVINGRQLLDCSPGLRIDTRSIRVLAENTLIPSQVDQKDCTGDYVATPNHMLDPDDEICFQVSLKPKDEREYHIYFSEEQESEIPRGSDLGYRVVPEMTPETPYNLLMTNSVIEVGIAGYESPKIENEIWKTWHSGSISHLKKKDIDIFRYVWVHGDLPNMKWNGWPSQPDKPEILVKGPVRMIAAVRYRPADLRWNRGPATWSADGSLKNAAQTYYYQISSGSRLIEFTEDIRYDKALTWHFRRLWEFTAAVGGGRLRPEQVVYSSFKGEARQQNMADVVAKHFVDGTLTSQITLGAEDDGWVAFLDPVRKNGLGIFGEPGKNSASITFPKGAKLGGNASPEFHIAFFMGRIPAKRLVRHYWFLVLDDEDIEAAMNRRTAYLNPLSVYVTRWERNTK